MVVMILVTGATGTIGGEVVRQLVARGEKVRALTRDPAGARVPDGVEVVRGDYREPGSLEPALSGVTAAFLVGVPGPGTRHDVDLVAAARAAGVPRLVKLSAIGTGDPELGPSASWHVEGEGAVRDSGAEWTILRPSTFASNTRSWADAIRAGDPVPNLTGDGTQGVVDPRDVSEVAVRALVEERHAGRTYTLTGPETISVPGQAAVLSELLGRSVTARDLSTAEIREYALGWGMGEEVADGLVVATAYVRRGGNAVVTPDVPDVLGRPARTYREWARDHAGEFREG
ncbi:SDR family oxidoreductase [Streptomyces sp. YU58]|uniref:SDR family oxidoreductase n=1 Tax=Streptomyces sp. SX92 TaxID=3158972 RepID=UPI0027BA1212|nr:SDR family oxidoreductase [Streptomyces coralus]WLW51233.1 SDR family oxidoreductase [Streptomyces coralus]